MENQRKKIIIIGGGFGGSSAIHHLATSRPDLDILLLDKKNHFVFQPLLYQVATAQLSPSQISYPFRTIFKKYKNVRVLIGNVSHIDKEKKYVSLTKSNQTFSYDYLIVSTGARHSYFGRPEWETYAWGLKTNFDAIQIRERMLYSFEKAERTRFEEKRRRFSTFVIVGAGPTGVEMAGAISELTKTTLVKEFSTFDTRSSRILLIEGSNRVLNRYDPSLSEKAKTYLEKCGVEVWLNSVVVDVTSTGVKVGDSFIETENIIWAAGNTASPLIESITEKRNRMGQAEVNSDFSIQEDHSIFCIGDCAYLEDKNKCIVPAVAQGAVQAGTFVSKQIINDLNGKPRETFAYHDKGKMATIGKAKAIAQIKQLKLTGFMAWILWSFVHVMFLIDFKSRLLVFIDWTISYFTNKRSVRLIISARNLR